MQMSQATTNWHLAGEMKILEDSTPACQWSKQNIITKKMWSMAAIFTGIPIGKYPINSQIFIRRLIKLKIWKTKARGF